MKNTVQGKFEITAVPLTEDEATRPLGLMRICFRKIFSGGLEAQSLVSMMGLMNEELGSGGYVALEKVEGKLDGRSGSFFLQHSSTLARGKQVQNIRVVPDSGAQELSGLTGELMIEIIDGQHFYIFHYELT